MKTKSILLLAAITLTTYSCKSSEEVTEFPTTSQHTGCIEPDLPEFDESRSTRADNSDEKSYDEWQKEHLEDFLPRVTLNYEKGILKGLVERIRQNCAITKLGVKVSAPESGILRIDIDHATGNVVATCLCYYDCSFEAREVQTGQYKVYVYQNGRLYYDGQVTLSEGSSTSFTLEAIEETTDCK